MEAAYESLPEFPEALKFPKGTSRDPLPLTKAANWCFRKMKPHFIEHKHYLMVVIPWLLAVPSTLLSQHARTRELFLAAQAVVFLLAYWSLTVQIEGLLVLLPVSQLTDGWYAAPSCCTLLSTSGLAGKGSQIAQNVPSCSVGSCSCSSSCGRAVNLYSAPDCANSVVAVACCWLAGPCSYNQKFGLCKQSSLGSSQ